MDQDRSSDHLVLGGLLFLVFSLVVALVFVYTRAGDTTTSQQPTTSATINNVAPTVDTVNVALTSCGSHVGTSTGITLSLGSTAQVFVCGQVSDLNGTDATGTLAYGDIADLSAVLYRSGATSTFACTADLNDCYRGATSSANSTTTPVGQCVLSGSASTTLNYSCTFNLQYFADGTKEAGSEFVAEEWRAYVKVTDLSVASDTEEVATEVNALLALNIPDTIAYGSFALGATTTSANNQDMILSQRGNVRSDVTVAGTAMACSGLGSIPVGNQKWSIVDVGYTHASATALTGSGVDTDIDVYYQKDDNFLTATSTKTLTWNIGIPTSGVRGTCTGTNTISILAH